MSQINLISISFFEQEQIFIISYTEMKEVKDDEIISMESHSSY